MLAGCFELYPGRKQSGDQRRNPDVSGFASTSDIPDVSNLATKDEIPDVSGFASTSDIPDVSTYRKTKSRT